MQFSTLTFALLAYIFSSSFAAPVPATSSSASVLTTSTYNELSISAGTAGNAKAEAAAKFPVDLSNLAGVSAADLAIIQGAHDIAENAEGDGKKAQLD